MYNRHVCHASIPIMLKSMAWVETLYADMTQSQMFQKVESDGGPFLKVGFKS